MAGPVKISHSRSYSSACGSFSVTTRADALSIWRIGRNFLIAVELRSVSSALSAFSVACLIVRRAVVWAATEIMPSTRTRAHETSCHTTRHVKINRTNISRRWRTRATRCVTANVPKTKVDARCHKLATELSWQHLRWSTFSSYSELFVESRQS